MISAAPVGQLPWPLSLFAWSPLAPGLSYTIDRAQRNVLLLDVLRQRGNQFREHASAGAPPVLIFDYELLIDGATLPRPVNYFLLRIIPGPEHVIDPTKRPYVIVDPRAGHGPGIGGSKVDSQVGVALRAGHAVYFVGFRPQPEPGQTLEDVGAAEAHFLREVLQRHPQAPRPALVGNCQAGWAVAMLSAVTPELMGAIILNGAPLSYWAGKEGANPMRYSGGLWGGSWVTSLLADLGDGSFDGANLVLNFERFNPANALWGKLYHLYANIDTEPERFLAFEKWWTGFFLMNREEMEAIVNNLFVGNKLAAGQVTLRDGRQVRLEDIKCPIIVFASDGDTITAPQQALNWILDVYQSDDEIVADGQVIIYTLHPDIGHLGIFTSGKVARKETTAIFSTLDFVELLPPGLYEMIIDNADAVPAEPDLDPRDYAVRFVERSLADLAMIDDTRAEERSFSTLAQVSELNSTLYQAWLRPWVQLSVNERSAEWLRRLHPLRLQYTFFSDLNPLMKPVKYWAELVRKYRLPSAPDNPLTQLEHGVSTVIETNLEQYREIVDSISASWFQWFYGPLALGALFKPEPSASDYRSPAERAFSRERTRLLERMAVGDFPEGALRLMLALSHADRDIEEGLFRRMYELLPRHPRFRHLVASEIATILKEQFLTLYLDREGAMITLPALLPRTADRHAALELATKLVLGDSAPNAAEQAVLVELAAALRLTDAQHEREGWNSGYGTAIMLSAA